MLSRRRIIIAMAALTAASPAASLAALAAASCPRLQAERRGLHARLRPLLGRTPLELGRSSAARPSGTSARGARVLTRRRRGGLCKQVRLLKTTAPQEMSVFIKSDVQLIRRGFP